MSVLDSPLCGPLSVPFSKGISGFAPSIDVGQYAAIFGDSFTAQNYGLESDADAISQQDHGTGVTLWLAESGHPFTYNVCQKYGTTGDAGVRGYSKGISGNTTTQMLARISDITDLDPAPKIVFFMGGTNDINSGTGADAIIANIDSIADIIFGIGATLAIYTITPRNSTDGASDWSNAAYKDVMLDLNNKIRGRVASWVSAGLPAILIDAYSYFADSSNNAKTGYTRDGVHPSPLGAQMGLLPAHKDAFNRYELTDLTREWETTPFNASTAPYGNLNPDLEGTGGNLDTAMTGVVAADWRAGRVSGSNISGVGSKVSAPDGGSDAWQRIVVTSTGGGSGNEEFRFRPDPVNNTNTVANEWYLFQFQIKIHAGAPDGLLAGTYLKLDERSSPDRDTYGGRINSTDTALNGGEYIRTVRACFMQSPSTGADFRFEVRLPIKANVSGSVTFDIGRCTMKRLEVAPDFGD